MIMATMTIDNLFITTIISQQKRVKSNMSAIIKMSSLVKESLQPEVVARREGASRLPLLLRLLVPPPQLLQTLLNLPHHTCFSFLSTISASLSVLISISKASFFSSFFLASPSYFFTLSAISLIWVSSCCLSLRSSMTADLSISIFFFNVLISSLWAEWVLSYLSQWQYRCPAAARAQAITLFTWTLLLLYEWTAADGPHPLPLATLIITFKFKKMILEHTLPTMVLVLSLVASVHAHFIRQINEPAEKVTAYVHQSKSVPIPFKKCFQVSTELPANQKYINFKPTSLALNPIMSYSLQHQSTNLTIADDLRTPIIYKHKHLLVFAEHLLVFSAPKSILILKESGDEFRLVNKYTINELDKFDQFKIFKLSHDQALLVIYNKPTLYLLTRDSYSIYNLPRPSTIAHLQSIPNSNSREFIAADFVNGLNHYRLTQKGDVEIVQRVNSSLLGLKQGQLQYVVDVNLNFYSPQHQIVYLLDAQIGVIQTDLLEPSKSKVIITQKGCESFDAIEQDHFVLLCQNQGHSSMVEAYRYIQKKTGQPKYRKVEPIFHANYLNDLFVGDKYYIIYSHKNIHVFWNTLKNRLPQTLDTQSEITLPALETFFVHPTPENTFLYTVEAGKLSKYSLVEEKPTLTLQSDDSTLKTFKILMYGSCLDLVNLSQEATSDKVDTCRVSKDIMLKVTAQDYPRQEDFSISASIIVILITMFLLIIWICLKKYKGLEKEARKVLDNYQRKKTTQRRPL